MRATFLLIFASFFASCNPQSDNPFIPGGGNDNDDISATWSIPSDEIFDGGPGKDGIPSIDLPSFISAGQVDFLNDDDLVIVVSHNDELKAYPHPILDWHEIVNDRIGDFAFALTYCPLTGTAINWNRFINGEETTFGVSGLLYNSNLIPYDRKTDSNWSQILLYCVNGENSGQKIETIPVFEGLWRDVKNMAELQVLSTDTGVFRNYGMYPYGDYRTNHSNLIFPLSNTDDRKNAKDRVLGVLENSRPKVYSFDDFTSNDEEIILDNYGGKSIMIVGSKDKKYIVGFYPDSDRVYEPIDDAFPFIVKDDLGSEFDIFGNSRDASARLSKPEQFIGYWFSWAAFYPDLEVFSN